MKFFSYDSRFSQVMLKVCYACCLNLLWAVCSIPIFTIGAATAAMYDVSLRIVRDEEYYIAQYADAAFQHQFCQAAGNTEAAGHFAEMMECARQASGSLAAVTGDIDRLLESIPLYP